MKGRPAGSVRAYREGILVTVEREKKKERGGREGGGEGDKEII